MNNIKLNTFVVYFSRVYTAIIGLLVLPELLEKLGNSQYGLIGSFTVLQACLLILDAGVGGVLTREAIKSKVNVKSFKNFNVILNKVVMIFSLISVSIVLVGYYLSEKYAVLFFNTTLNNEVLVFCSFSMFIVFSLRYIQGPIKSVFVAYEKHLLLSVIDILYITISSPLALLVIIGIDGDIKTYFIIQMLSSFVKTILLYTIYYSFKNKMLNILTDSGCVISSNIRELFSFGGSLSLLSILWVIVNQSDKVILIKEMNLNDYTYYGIALTVVSLIGLFSNTMNQIIRPRLIHYYSVNEYKAFTQLFKDSFGIFLCIIIPLTVFICLFGYDLVYLWIGDDIASVNVMKYLPFLFIGGLFLSLSEFSFIIQYSHGKLKTHTIFYIFISLIVIPVNVFIAERYLGVGASISFMVVNIFIFLTWSIYRINKYVINSIIYMLFSGILYFIFSIIIFLIYKEVNLNINGMKGFIILFFYGVSAVFGCLIIFKLLLSKINLEYRGV